MTAWRLALPGFVALLAFAASKPAEAKIPIPCMGDRIVKVRDVGIKRPDGKTVDLGYLFPGCFSEGQWVGYIGSTSSYVPLTDEARAALFQAAGYSEPPPPPSRWSYPFDALFMELLTAVALVGFAGYEGVKHLLGASSDEA